MGLGASSEFPYVVKSEITIDADGSNVLEDAFRNRLGKVDAWPGFGHLEVWRDLANSTKFIMVSWWASQADFAAYMKSADHRESHDRIPTDPHKPAAERVNRYEIVAS